MTQPSAKLVRGVRTSLSLRNERASERRTLDERLLLRFPSVLPIGGRIWMRMPLRSRLRQLVLTRNLKRFFAALNRRDLAVCLLGLHPQIEFRVTRDFLGPDQAEVVYGHEGLLQFLQAWFEAFEDIRYEPEEVLDLGDMFLVTQQLYGTGLGSGAAVTQRIFVLSHAHQGLVVKQETFLDRAKALEAAGLSE